MAADYLPDDFLAGDYRRRDRGQRLGYPGDGRHGRGSCGIFRLYALHPHRPIHDRRCGQSRPRRTLRYQQAADFSRCYVDRRRLRRARHVSLWYSGAGAAADRTVADAVRDRRHNHWGHRQHRGRSDRGGNPRHNSERQHSFHLIRVAGIPTLYLPVPGNRVFPTVCACRGAAAVSARRRAIFRSVATRRPPKARPERSWNISTASSSLSAFM